MKRKDALARRRWPALAWANAPTPSDPLTHVGAQSFSFRQFDLAGALEALGKIGLDTMEFCAVHFKPDPEAPDFPAVQQALRDAGVQVPCFGVEGFGADAEANRVKFAFAQALGIGVLTADPAPEAFGHLGDLCAEYGVRIAIHNHGPGARYDKVADTLAAVEGQSAAIGACLDTGHAIRSGEMPHEVIETLGDRLISLHLKDWCAGGEETVLGQGDMDLVAVARALRRIAFTGPIVMEYENSPENPGPEMAQGYANWCAAVARA